ncbi:GfV-A10-ORF1 [Ichnoviriform fumiferanae]|uniref:GfV-A10-ORF1 n=1 Tax=Ichnoviriform fumiferanae TaxID=419435 RepID=A2PZQ2_9VIRU|nr:GfV-A10-ORF1 [Ichnoviriform fumiferanae]BAF45474.1 GfV-A10-ORF1 [Ichnoviriform fumiferanae]
MMSCAERMTYLITCLSTLCDFARKGCDSLSVYSTNMDMESSTTNSNEQEGASTSSGLPKPITATAFAMRHNRWRNRRPDIPCFDHSRVILRNVIFGRSSPSDYIHANFVDGFKRKKMFIATQAPTEKTVEDFLDLVMQSDSRYIIVMTAIMENGINKCYPYWPMKIGHLRMFNLWRITLDSKYSGDGYTKYLLKITHVQLKTINHNITLVYYINWPQNSVWTNHMEFKNFVKTVVADINYHRREDASFEPPIIVHGCLGVYRTIVYCIAHDIQDMIGSNESQVSDEMIDQSMNRIISMRYTRIEYLNVR